MDGGDGGGWWLWIVAVDGCDGDAVDGGGGWWWWTVAVDGCGVWFR